MTTMKGNTPYRPLLIGIIGMLIISAVQLVPLLWPRAVRADKAAPPANTVKLVFIHHSCGENWLADGNGNLGKTLDQNNYFVSDTNYGWGPHSIGDSTDITDWPRWFTGSERKRYLKALYRESGQHSSFTRSKRDPGGENQVVMFKSCFPNSNLHGQPHETPQRGEGLSVSNAKAIYNDLLAYFATRPDKLFIAITAPPVQDRTYAANARAFNRWLVNNWLKNYQGDNVAVFDFYNVLTGPGNHHRFRNGQIEHVVADGRNILYYPSGGDDHPSHKGNCKATAEIVPLINVYYHRWLAGQGFPSPVVDQPIPDESLQDAGPPASGNVPAAYTQNTADPVMAGNTIDDFEKDANEWAVFSDEGNSKTQLRCSREASEGFRGKAGLTIAYTIAPESWATCSLVFPAPQDWRGKQGLSLYLRTERPGQELHVVAYQGDSADSLSHFEFRVLTTIQTVADWQRIDIPWKDFIQPAWEGDGSAGFDPGRAMGLAFAFNGAEGGETTGKIWVDDICFLPK
jgi:Carbohydrate binding domain (family 11)